MPRWQIEFTQQAMWDAPDMARDLIRAVPSEQQQSEFAPAGCQAAEAISKTRAGMTDYA